mmetsp:Transcript_68227/g.209232  ORF Transcript_68227/g.209232 Transcript_68227/m.209232 type:complete len:272 (+) Transcript_68227:417-1232(+)
MEISGVVGQPSDVKRALVVVVVSADAAWHQARRLEALDDDLNRKVPTIAASPLLGVPCVREAHLDGLAHARRHLARNALNGEGRLLDAPESHEGRSPGLAPGQHAALHDVPEGAEDLLQRLVVDPHREAFHIDVVAWSRLRRFAHGPSALAAASALDRSCGCGKRLCEVRVKASAIGWAIWRESVPSTHAFAAAVLAITVAFLAKTSLSFILELHVNRLGEPLRNSSVHVGNHPRGMLQVGELDQTAGPAIVPLPQHFAPDHFSVSGKDLL